MALTKKAQHQREETELYIATVLLVRAHEKGIDIPNNRLVEMIGEIRASLPASQVFGVSQLDRGQIEGLVQSELLKRTETAQQLKRREAETAAKATGEAGPDMGKVVPLVWRRSVHFGDLFSDTRNSSRFDGINGSTSSSASTSGSAYWSTPAGITEMRTFALAQGVAWAANNPELLKLGPNVIRDIATSGLDQNNYKRLKDAGYEAKDVGTIAAGVKTLHLTKDQNRDLFDDVATVSTGEGPQAKRYRDDIKQQLLALSQTKDPAQRKVITDNLNKTLHDAAGDDPEKKKAADHAASLLAKAAEAKVEKEKNLSQKLEVQDVHADVAVKAVALVDKSVDKKEVAEVKSKDASTKLTKLDDDLLGSGTQEKSSNPGSEKKPTAKASNEKAKPEEDNRVKDEKPKTEKAAAAPKKQSTAPTPT